MGDGDATGTYLYGIVRPTHPLRLTGRTGVGAPPAPVRRIDAGELVVVASDAPERLRAKRRDLLAHERLLEELCAQGTTLPMRFGSVAEDDAAVRALLAGNARRYAAALSEVDGRVEVNVKAGHHEETMLRELLAANPDLRRRNEELRQRDGGGHEERVRFGELVASAVEAREIDDADRIVRALRLYAVRESAGSRVADRFLNMSFLLDREQLDAFEAAAAELGRSLGDAVDVRVRGPLPPYSFTDLPPAG